MYKKTSSDHQWSTFFAPLHFVTWIVGLILLLVVGFGYSLTGKLSPTKDDPLDSSRTFTFLILLYAPFGQGQPSEPSSLSSQILFMTIYWTAWLIWASYSSMLMAHLSVQVERLPFNNLFDLVHSSDYKVMVMKGDSAVDRFKVVSYPYRFSNAITIFYLVWQ